MEQAACGNGVHDAFTRWKALRVMDDQRHMHQLLIHYETMPQKIMFAMSFAMIGADNHHRVIQLATVFEPLEQAPDMVILAGDFGIVEVVEGFVFPILKRRISWAFPTGSVGIKAPHEGIHVAI